VTRRIRRRPEVKTDILQIARYIAANNFEAAMRFFDAVEADITKLTTMPGMGGLMELPATKLAGMRSMPIRGFPNHLIIYRLAKGQVEILAVVHGARDLQSIIGERI
jgi:toxin ParE1/3/4